MYNVPKEYLPYINGGNNQHRGIIIHANSTSSQIESRFLMPVQDNLTAANGAPGYAPHKICDKRRNLHKESRTLPDRTTKPPPKFGLRGRGVGAPVPGARMLEAMLEENTQDRYTIDFRLPQICGGVPGP